MKEVEDSLGVGEKLCRDIGTTVRKGIAHVNNMVQDRSGDVPDLFPNPREDAVSI